MMPQRVLEVTLRHEAAFEIDHDNTILSLTPDFRTSFNTYGQMVQRQPRGIGKFVGSRFTLLVDAATSGFSPWRPRS
jgi:hypothetical protein